MSIVNGTFDTDLSGWVYNPDRYYLGNIREKTFWENGKAHLTNGVTGACEGVYPWLRQDFLITDTTISFDCRPDRRSINGQCYFQGLPNQGSATFKWSLIAHIPTIDPTTGNTIITDETVYDEILPAPTLVVNTYTPLPDPEYTIIRDVSPYIGKEATLTFEFYTTPSSCGCGLADMWIDNVINSPNWGTFRASSVPGGSDIYIDNSFINITPETGSIDLTNISPGNHTVKITKTDYYDYSITVYVYPGRIYEIIATLNPKVGCISILSDPTGAKIYLSDRNGQTLNDTGFITLKQICDLLWGDYKWKLTLQGYDPKSGIASLTSASGINIIETLSLIGIGCIYFDTNPSGAKIIVDGIDTGLVTPNKICDLALGEHTYRLELSGYRIETGSVILTSTQGELVSINLISCVPNWQCETPLNGYEFDGCGNRRTNSACNPPIAEAGMGGGAILIIGGSILGLILLFKDKKRYDNK